MGSSSVVSTTPRNSHEPKSRDTRLVCLPWKPSAAPAASGFSIRGAVSTKTLARPGVLAQTHWAMVFSRPLIRA